MELGFEIVLKRAMCQGCQTRAGTKFLRLLQQTHCRFNLFLHCYLIKLSEKQVRDK
jgi:hypothetical protein